MICCVLFSPIDCDSNCEGCSIYLNKLFPKEILFFRVFVYAAQKIHDYIYFYYLKVNYLYLF